MTAQDVFNQYAGKRVAFITTKNLNYIRNCQEIELISQNCKDMIIIGSNQKNYIFRIIRVWLQVLFSSFRKYDVVFVGFAPQLVCPFLAWKFCGPVHIDFFISLYDTFVNDRKVFKEGGIFAGMLKHLDRKTIDIADLIVCDTRAHGDYFSMEFGAEKEKEVILYLEANSHIYYPRKPFKREALKDKYIVLYFGSILPLQGVEVILACIKLLKEDNNIFFQMIGPIKESDTVGLENAEFISWLKEEELAECIAGADLCLAGHFNAMIDKAKRTIPGKAYIYEAMGKPMILGDNSANRELFRDDQKHFFVEMGNAAALAKKIRECCESEN